MSSKKFREAGEVAGFLQRMAAALVKRAGGGELDALTAIRDTKEWMKTAEVEAAQALHYDRGYTWATIGETLGITRQAAEKRFKRDEEDEG